MNDSLSGGYGIRGLDLRGTYDYSSIGLGSVTLTGPYLTRVTTYPFDQTMTVMPDTACYLECSEGNGEILNMTFPAGVSAFELHR